jgi:hypothetical protein
MDDARLPETEPSGALVPQATPPPSALAIAAPVPPRRWEDEISDARGFFTRTIDRTLDALDQVGDSIASAVGLR